MLATSTLLFFLLLCSADRQANAACPYANELSGLLGVDEEKAGQATNFHHRHLRNKNKQKPHQQTQNGHLRSHHNRDLQESGGLLNAGKACMGHCNKTPGDCDYCGTGQCCRSFDAEQGVVGCELATATNVDWENGPGSQCGSFDGLMNEGKGCWSQCNLTPGDCDYCGTGQCCRKRDYDDGIDGCELAFNAVGARCGRFRGEPEERLRNEGKACIGQCNKEAGDCDFCGTGQCCRRFDADRCVPGCELANINWIEGGPGSQCGAFSDPTAACLPTTSPPALNPSSPTSDDNPPSDDDDTIPPSDDDDAPTLPPATELQNEGLPCGAVDRCNLVEGRTSPSADCDWCGTGQCCSDNDYRRGVFGCELAQNAGGNAVCGDFSSPHPEPAEFRLADPLGIFPTPDAPPNNKTDGIWIKDIEITGTDIDHAVPEYSGDGGKPWSLFEMAMVRDLLLHEIRQASQGRDETSSAKFIRLPFHDCLLYSDGTGGCDGCLNWDNVGNRFVGRVESRNFEDNQRTLSNNGLGDAVEFLEYIYTLDFGKTWANGCWKKPATVSGGNAWVGGTRTNPITVSSTEECQEHCQNTEGCQYFTVPHLRSVDATGPCRLFSNQGTVRELSGTGRLIAGNAYCTDESWSLQSTGKSRADLWAFASLVAVEEGIQRHNYACDGDRRSPFNGPIMCTQFEGEEGCHISLNRPFVFQTGRKDCDTKLEPSYKTEKAELQPDEH